MATNRKSESFPLQSLYGMEPPTADEIRRGMSSAEEKVRAQFDQHARRQGEQAESSAALRDEVLRERGSGAEPSAAVRRMKEAYQAVAGRTLPPPSARPDAQRIFTACVGATVVPPYNWPWTWDATSGSPTVSATADEKAGTISLSTWTDLNNSSSASAAGAVGIFFRPFTTNGILRLSSNPALNFDWGDWCAFDGAHSDGWIGLFIGEFDLSGTEVSVPIDQQITLWSDDSWWQGVGFQQGSNSGFPLSAQLNVDSNHFYEIWVWCGVDVSAAGWGTFSGSGAGADLSVSIPSITWELC
jgi:hypothetical protein